MSTIQKTDIDKSVVLGATKITVTRVPYRIASGPTAGQDIICLAGHCPGTGTDYDLIPVQSLEQILELFAGNMADTAAVAAVKASTMYSALVSCWVSGGRNLAILRLGDDADFDGLTDDQRYQLIYTKLGNAYSYITDNEYIQYIVPVEAPAEGYTKADTTFLDFMQQAAFAAAKAINTGSFVQVMLSTESSDVTILANAESIRKKEDWQFKDPGQSYCYSSTLGWLPNNDAYRFVAVPAGRALFSYPEFDVSFEGGLAPAIAGLSSSLQADVSSMGRVVPGVRLFTRLSQDDADALSLAGYMVLGETARQQRRRQTGAIVISDNTMAIPASDFQQEVVMRLTRRVSLAVRLAILPYIGTSGLGIETEVDTVLRTLARDDVIRDYFYRFARDPGDIHRLLLLVSVTPYLPVKALTIEISAGPFTS